MTTPARVQTSNVARYTALIAAVGLSAASIIVPSLQSLEGKSNVGYLDVVKVATACYGQTGAGIRVGQRYTDAQCDTMLDNASAGMAKAVLSCTPILRSHTHQEAAAVLLAYNIGSGNYCSSTVDRMFDAGQWAKACDAFAMWNKAGGKVVQGLVNRRATERALCYMELPS